MSTFLLFGGQHYYPVGGWNDFIFAGSLEECKAQFTNWEDSRGFDWVHIVDLSTKEKILVADGGGDSWRQVIWRTPTEDDR